MAARFPFARILIADVSASPDHDLLHYGASLAALGGGAVDTVSQRDLGTVLDAASRARADLLLFRDPQRWPEGRQLARRVVEQSPCSVWMVPVGAQPTLRRVVVDVGGSQEHLPALHLACALGRCAGAQSLIAVRVTQATSAPDSLPRHRDVKLEGLVAGLDTGAMHCSVHIDHSLYIARSLRRAAEKHRADLLVVSASSDKPRRWPYTRSDANELAGDALTALLSVHESAARPSLRDRVRRLFTDTSATH